MARGAAGLESALGENLRPPEELWISTGRAFAGRASRAAGAACSVRGVGGPGDTLWGCPGQAAGGLLALWKAWGATGGDALKLNLCAVPKGLLDGLLQAGLQQSEAWCKSDVVVCGRSVSAEKAHGDVLHLVSQQQRHGLQ